MDYANIEARYNPRKRSLLIKENGDIIYQKNDCCCIVGDKLVWEDINQFPSIVGKTVRRELSNYMD